MEQRFKILNALTVIVIILFIVVQGDWLYSRYKYMVQTCTDTLYIGLTQVHMKVLLRQLIL